MANILDGDTPVTRPGVYYSEFFEGWKSLHQDPRTYVTYLCKNYELCCNDTPRYTPSFSMSIESHKKVAVPKKTKLTRATEITAQAFEDFYRMNFKRLQEEDLDGAEFYQRDDGEEISLFALQGQKLFYIGTSIDPRYRAIDFNMDSHPGYFRRKIHKLKKIEPEIFKQAYHLLLEYFYDPDMVFENFPSVWAQLEALVNGEQPIHGIKINADIYFDNMIRTIKAKVRRLEKKLIDEDGTPEERTRIRGELKGMEYCLKVINEYR